MIFFIFVIFVSLVLFGYYRFRVNTERISSKASINYRSVQRKTLGTLKSESDSVLEFLEGSISRDRTDFARDLEKKLYCAGWNIPRSVFHLIEFGLSLGLMVFSYVFLSIPFVIFSIFLGPVLCRGVLDFLVERKARMFEQDFAHFIMSTVSLLKTGVAPMLALEGAAKVLEENSLVRKEVESFIEAVRNGFNEEKALSRFGDTIYSPILETFVQILLAGKKFGGSLADSLERLAALVRRKTAFQLEAKAALAQAKASMWVVAGAFLLCLFLFVYTFEGFAEAISTKFGRAVFHFVIVINLTAMLIFRNLVRIKI